MVFLPLTHGFLAIKLALSIYQKKIFFQVLSVFLESFNFFQEKFRKTKITVTVLIIAALSTYKNVAQWIVITLMSYIVQDQLCIINKKFFLCLILYEGESVLKIGTNIYTDNNAASSWLH